MRIVDHAIKDPVSYREKALSLQFRTYDFGHCVFHGIATGAPSNELFGRIYDSNPDLTPMVSFLRKSPFGQVEPHFIHSDIDMGDWTAILYLNPNPPEHDGTAFWTHKASGAIESKVPHERSEEGRNPENWELRELVPGLFNRLLMFPSSYFHSRAIPENWGSGDDSRLIHVVFGKGAL